MEQLQSFIKGFNDGFILAKYEQATARQLSNISRHSPYAIGLVSGIAEIGKEMRLIKEFDALRESNIHKDKTIGR
jgi:hypothetical protein